MKTTDISPTLIGRLRRVFVSVVPGVLILTTFTALIYAVENWRGARAWTSTLEALRASGQKIALEDFEPPPVPDESNAAMHPALRCFSYTLPGGRRATLLKADQPDPADVVMAAKWRKFMAWRQTSPDAFAKLHEVLEGEDRNPASAQAAARELGPVLAEHLELMNAVEEALQRPFCQWPRLQTGDHAVSVRGEYAATLGSALLETSRFFYIRKLCEAIPSGSLSAWNEGVGIKRYAQAAASPKTLMNFLLVAAIRNQHEGLVINLLELTQPDPQRCFSAEAELAAQPLMSEVFGEYMRGERAFMIAAMSSLLAQEDPSDLSKLISGQAPAKGWERVERAVRKYGPVGWIKQNMANTVRGSGELIESVDSSTQPVALRERVAKVISSTKSKGALFHWMEKGTVGIYSGLYENVMESDARQHLLRTILLIAAHRSETGLTPMSLDELPVELRARIPVNPWKGGLPKIKRDETGVWTLAYVNQKEEKTVETEWSIRIRGW
jgi:hypothetical protein